MLPLASSRRMVALLNRMLQDCAEQEEKLERNLARCRTLLQTWEASSCDRQHLISSAERCPDQPAAVPESGPSPEELRELDLLTRALEKAARVRQIATEAKKQEQGAAPQKTAPPSLPPGPQRAAGRKAASPAPPLALQEPTPLPQGGHPKSVSYRPKAPYRTDPNKKRVRRRVPAPRLGGLAPRDASGPRRGPGSGQPTQSPPSLLPGEGKGTRAPQGDAAGRGPTAPSSQQRVGGLPGSVPGFGRTSGCRMPESAEERTVPGAFTFQENGTLLKLPQSYKKLYAQNASLWAQSQACRTEPAAEEARGCFVAKIQATFAAPGSVLSPGQIWEEVQLLSEACRLLGRRMDQVEACAAPGEELEPVSLQALERLGAAVGGCLRRLEELRRGVDRGQGPLVASDLCSCARVGAVGCPAGRAPAVPLLTYSSAQELQELAALRLRVATLTRQIHLEKVLMAELLPLLESRWPQEPGLYRAVHTQLCDGGRRFPVLLWDDPPD
ncbi:tubulin epsilon and delta complex protein 2 [Tachyglossus aculeatus]|uniref:tubulin epsilon and delta complex protein 2 n=1 Tax=Tachyglossus aculeatus TaxID=9261 RepID=UPI0018F6FDF9|nr:tubulin epsilon and delta complex protein 2 [Tachyglossus aculeatus]